MTSAVDIIAPKPAARPEPSAKAASHDDDRSFADALDAEIAEPEAAPATKDVAKEAAPTETVAKDEPVAPDTNTAAQPAQPQQQQPTPAVNSPEAILAGLTQAAPTDAPTAEAGAETPAIDAAAPAAQASAAAAATPAATAAAAQAAPKSPATQQSAAPQADAAPVEPAEEAIAATPAATQAVPTQTAQAAPAVPATPTADAAAPLSAPGEERTSATIEAANTSTNKATAPATNAAADPSANKAEGAQAKTTQVAANPSADAAPDIKTEAPAPAATTTVDALASARSASDTARAAQTSPALQNAPATTIQVYQRMVERFDGRAQRYEIRLDPAELGRVDVRIEVGADKKVHAVLAAHDSAALTDLMRGQRSLERALSDAGFDLAEGGIRFEMSGDQGRNPANDTNGNGRSNVWRGFNTVDVAVDAQTAAAARPWRSSARLDVVA